MHGCEGLSMDQKEGRRALHERAWPAFDFFRPMRRGFIRFFFVRRRMRWGTLCYLCNYPPPALPINPKGLSRVWLPTENVARDLPTFIFFLVKQFLQGKRGENASVSWRDADGAKDTLVFFGRTVWVYLASSSFPFSVAALIYLIYCCCVRLSLLFLFPTQGRHGFQK